MQASSSAREILDARGLAEAISEAKAGLTCGRLEGGGATRDTQTAALAPLRVTAQRWCCAMPVAPLAAETPRRGLRRPLKRGV